ncbi:molybdopterin-dependent oxidoreductase [Chloroflexota bacterium]
MPVSSTPNDLSRRDFMRVWTGSAASDQGKSAVADAGMITYDTPVLTPNDRFYRMPCLSPQVPILDRQSWSLTVDGLVRQPLALSYADLRDRPAVGQMRTLISMGNPPGGDQIGNAVWRGCLLEDLLTEVQVQPSATHLRFETADGYHTSVPLEHILTNDVLLAYEMNGALLSPAQGHPLRVLVPGLYDLKSPGWVTRLTLLDHEDRGYWERDPHNWSNTAVIKTQSKIIMPLTQQELLCGAAVAMQGVAFAGLKAITGVQVSINRGGWMPAALRSPDSDHAWTQWYALWSPQLPGDYEITVRATDETGYRQEVWPSLQSDAFPAGSSTMHSLTVSVV